MERATKVKALWEKTFQEMATKYCDAKLCLNAAGKCSACEGQANIIHIKSWSAIRESTLSCQAVSIQRNNIARGKMRLVCDKYYKERNKGANAPSERK
jgi:hypothetical protein